MKIIAHANPFENINSFDNKRVIWEVVGNNLFDLTSQWSAAPSSTKSGTVAAGTAYGSTLPGAGYPSSTLGGINSQGTTGAVNLLGVNTAVKGATTTSTPPPPTTNPNPVPSVDNNVGSVGYDPSFPGQTVTVGGKTFRANNNGGWDLVGGGEDEINNQINEAYGSSYDYLNKVEQNLKDQLPGTLNTLESDYSLNNKMLGDANQANSAQLDFQGNQAAQSNETQAAKIRRLYNELQQGYRQRFGGSTSAGEAASEIANVEQQRQTGQLAQQYANTVQQIAQQKKELDTNFQNASQKLLQAKQQAIQQANQDFTSKLLQIAQNRAELDTNKAQARLSALLDLRNKIFTIEQQNTQFQQTLALNKQAAELNLQGYNQAGTASVNAGNQAATGFQQGLTNPQSNLQANKSMSTSQAPAYTGSISNKDPYQLVGSITPSYNYYDRLQA